MSFYHLPHPWDPGYAIPAYVKAEPPERGTFTTAWMPRGTIPNLVPDYFANPMGAQKLLGRDNAGLSGLGSLGGSTLAGSTLRGNTLAGSTLRGSTLREDLGANEYVLEPLGNGMGAITKYGATTAKGMIARVRRLPQAQRALAMKAAMDQIEPTLRTRCERYATAAQKAGMPAPKALEVGLARALSEGVTGELARLGRSRSLPQPSSLLGLGLDCARARQGALGAVANLNPFATVTTGGKVTGAAPASSPAKSIKVGPFSMPAGTTNSWGMDFKSPTQIPAEWRTIIGTAMKRGFEDSKRYKAYWANWTSAIDLTKVPSGTRTRDHFIWRGQNENWKGDICNYLEALGIKCGRIAVGTEQVNPNGGPFGGVVIAAPEDYSPEFFAPVDSELTWQQMRGEGGEERVVPVAKFKHPITGDDWGVFFSYKPPMKGRNLMPTDGYGRAYVYFARIPGKPWYHKVWAVLKYIPSKIDQGFGKLGEGIADVVGWVGDQTCQLVTNPAALTGIAGGASKAPGGAGIAIAGGALVAAQMCGGLQPPPPPFFPPQSSLLPWLLVGGGVIAAIALTRKQE